MKASLLRGNEFSDALQACMYIVLSWEPMLGGNGRVERDKNSSKINACSISDTSCSDNILFSVINVKVFVQYRCLCDVGAYIGMRAFV